MLPFGRYGGHPRTDVSTQQAVRPARAIQKRSSTLGPPRAVVTEDAASYGVLATVRALHAGGYEPWVAINGTRSYARYSRACAGTVTVPDPATDARRYRQRLAAAAAALGATIVLPGTDVALLALAGKEGLFGP